MDTDARTDKAWLLDVQRKLYQWSRENPEGQYRELWGWVTDLATCGVPGGRLPQTKARERRASTGSPSSISRSLE